MNENDNLKERCEVLKRRHAILLEDCADLFERYNNLMVVEGPALSSEYMMAIGRHELREFQLLFEVNRWRRRFEMRQRYINLGEQVDLVAIEKALDEEMASYQKMIDAKTIQVERAIAYLGSDKLSPEQSHEVRFLYLKAAKRLHPDVNPQVSEVARELWNRIKNAYESRQWAELTFLSGMVDSVAGTARTFSDDEIGVAEREKEIARLEEVCRKQRQIIADQRKLSPWCYAGLLSDSKAVAARQREIFLSIQQLCSSIDIYERRWKMEAL